MSKEFDIDNALVEEILEGKRISVENAIDLFNYPLSTLSKLAEYRKRAVSEDYVYFNRNIHIEPTNICINHCLFCSYRARKGDAHAWEFSMDNMKSKVQDALKMGITEIHLVGGVHPDWDIKWYSDILRMIRQQSSKVHIKAFTAEEIYQMSKNANMSIEQGIQKLIEAGLNSIPGGGAEIFDRGVRDEICPDKIDGPGWLQVHEAIHKAGLKSNCTMLYGHIETLQQRVDHLHQLRQLQDRTGGFNAFIPLKFKSANNKLSQYGETSSIDDLKTYAISRIFLDNIPHIKAYWPMLGKNKASVTLAFGVDDLDGTIHDSTKIYSLAGSDEQRPAITISEIESMARSAGFTAVERDSLYNII